jgi:hypothetical protein
LIIATHCAPVALLHRLDRAREPRVEHRRRRRRRDQAGHRARLAVHARADREVAVPAVVLNEPEPLIEPHQAVA